MANAFQQIDVLDIWLRDRLRQVDTFKPARVLAVKGNRLDARILTKTPYAEKQVEQPDVFDVPYQILSAKKGAVKITFPISPGDNVMIAFSDRDFGNLMDYTDVQLTEIQNRGDGTSLAPDSDDLFTHRYEAIMAFPQWFTEPEEVVVDPNNIVIENQNTNILVSPDGTITMNTSNFIVNADNTRFRGGVQIDRDLKVVGKSEASDHISGGVSGKTHTHITTAVTGGGGSPGTISPPQ